jgi:hypothetical protein
MDLQRHIPGKYSGKIKLMQNIILSVSGLLTKYGKDNVSIELVDIDYNEKLDVVYEILFNVTLKDLDCDECAHKPENLFKIINETLKNITTGASFGLTSETLEFKNSFSSLRGVLFNSINVSYDTINSLQFTIYIDPGQKY